MDERPDTVEHPFRWVFMEAAYQKEGRDIRRTVLFGVDYESRLTMPSQDPDTKGWVDQFREAAKHMTGGTSGQPDPGAGQGPGIPISAKYKDKVVVDKDGKPLAGEERENVLRVISFSAGNFPPEQRVDIGYILDDQVRRFEKASPKKVSAFWKVTKDDTGNWTLLYTLDTIDANDKAATRKYGFIYDGKGGIRPQDGTDGHKILAATQQLTMDKMQAQTQESGG
jgi:hypothetical protein